MLTKVKLYFIFGKNNMILNISQENCHFFCDRESDLNTTRVACSLKADNVLLFIYLRDSPWGPSIGGWSGIFAMPLAVEACRR